MLRLRHSLLLVMLASAATLSACATAGTGGTASTARSGSVIYQDELQSVQASNMHDVITRLRSTWLRPASSAGVNPTLVFLDGNRMGGLEQLRQVPPASIREARFYTASEAQSRLALREAAAVIALVSAR